MVKYEILYTFGVDLCRETYECENTVINADEEWVSATDRDTGAVVGLYNKDFVVAVNLIAEEDEDVEDEK